jgi:glucuronate isomerase
MDSGGMSKRITTNNGFIWLNRHVHQVRNHATGLVNIFGIDIGIDIQHGIAAFRMFIGTDFRCNHIGNRK